MRLLLSLLFTAAALAQDPREIFRRSIEKDCVNRALRQQYTFLEKQAQENRVHGSRRFHSVRTPVPPADRKEWTAAERQGPAEGKRKNREVHGEVDSRKERLAHREKETAFLREIPDAYDLRLLADEKVDGKDAWVIQAEPHPGYRAKLDGAKYFAKIHGKIWIDKAEYQWVKADAETIDTISFGLILFRLRGFSAFKRGRAWGCF